MRREMFDLSEALEFEKAAAIRDRIKDSEEIRLSRGQPLDPLPREARVCGYSVRMGVATRGGRAGARCARPSVSHWRSRRDFAP